MRAMETELGVRIATRDRNVTFVTSETDAAIVIVGHLPGIRQEEIDISVNEEGTAVTISGRGQRFLSHAVTSGRRLRISNEVETRPFRKVFRIPNGVSLDQIDAGFDEQGGVLMVLMPKCTRGQNSPHEFDEEQEGPVQDTTQPDEENSARQKHPHEPETSEAGRGGDSKTSEQETPPIQQTIKGIEQDDRDSNRASENQQSTGMNPKDYIKKREKEPDPPPNPTTETIETLDQDGTPPQMDALEPNVETEQEEPFKEADLDVQTSEKTASQQDQPGKAEVEEDDAPEPKMDALEPNAVREQEEPIKEADPVVQTSEATSPQQDQPGKAEGEDDTPEPNVLPDLPQPKRQEAGGGEVSSEKPTDRPPAMEKLDGTDNVVAESRQQVVDATNEGDENDEETGSEASSEERRTDGDEKPEGEETAKKERVGRRRRRKRAGNGRASSLSHPLPQLVGSAFILSLVALVVHYMRNKRRGPS